MMLGQIETSDVVQQAGPERAPCGRELISVKALLEWAFVNECAHLDLVGDDVMDEPCGFGAEYTIMRQLELGKGRGQGVRVDTSFGQSRSHADAELVAEMLPWALGQGRAVMVTRYAKQRGTPQWDLGPQRYRPCDWTHGNQHGSMGRAEKHDLIQYKVRGRVREFTSNWVPVKIVPSVAQISCARRHYLDWWGALLDVLSCLRAEEFGRFVLTDTMPEMQPWKKTC